MSDQQEKFWWEGQKPRQETFTPGPWSWVIRDHSMATLCGLNSVGDHDGMEGHVMSSSPCKACIERANPKEWVWGRCLTPRLANAHLIAAAPELYEALGLAEFWLSGALECESWTWDADQREAAEAALAEIRRVLAKARGEA